MAVPRLHSRSIDDDLVRAELYRLIREGQKMANWNEYTVSEADKKHPERIAYRAYGVDFDTMKWVVCIAAGLDDWRDDLVPGVTLRLPSTAWIRGKIRELKRQWGEEG